MNEVTIVFAAVIWATCAGFAAYVASQKGRDAGGWALFGALFGIFALIAVCAVPVVKKKKVAKTPSGRAILSCPKTGVPQVEINGQVISLTEAKTLGF